RFVGELPDGLSAVDRHEILSRFCGSLADDGWMVVGAIHQPDRHNDRRNFHLHVDGVDRPAEWLDDPGCWDFEHTERRNGKVTHPDRQKKVRYPTPPAGLLRDRFITIVNEVLGDRLDIVRYLHGTYADNGIGLTPLEHMGNRATGLESRGVETDVGSRNARRILADDAAACEKRANEAEAALAGELVLIRTIVANDLAVMAALERYERLERRLIRRRLQRELADVVITMARSRAETVVHTLTPTPGRPVTPRKGDDQLLADARAHLAWVERNSPTPDEREAARRVEEALAARAADQWAIIQSATARLGQAPVMDVVVYVPRHQASAAAVRASRFDDQKRDRLRAWLRKHAADGDLLILDNGEARLGLGVPRAIDTLMRQFAHEPSFQRLLLAERHRRADCEMLSSETGRASSSSGKARPIAHASPSSAPSAETVQTLPIPEPGEAEPSPAVLCTTSISPTAPPAVAQSAHIAARQADRKPDVSGSPHGKQPNQGAPSGADRAGSTAPKDASTDRAPPTLETTEKSKASIFDQASSLPTAGVKRVAPKGPASSAAPVRLPTKGPER
ncbi:MobA/MobL family protein, partial [uncultured Sphingomonas sp.]|uniref:MobA/MobL family protein n=1 Tax=uncultured Sphingomonas sp. TaxID=158754 RepID=UPI00338DC1FB